MRKTLFILFAAAAGLTGCTWHHAPDDTAGYPEEIAEIVLGSCAVSGCHNDASNAAAAGLNLSSWDKLFLGSRGGSAVVPGVPGQSFLLYFINTDSSDGLVLLPRMPVGGEPLSRTQYHLIRDWIAQGARNAEGALRFPPDPARKKWYVANQGCDLVTVFDAESQQIMDYLEVGQLDGVVESPHMVRLSPDGEFWYVVFLAQNPYLEKYTTLNDEFVTRTEIGNGDWNTFSLSPDGRFGFAVAYFDRKVAVVDLENDSLVTVANMTSAIHGSFADPLASRLYVTKQDESGLYVLEYDANGNITGLEDVDLIQHIPPAASPPLLPHEVIFTPDGGKYLVTCQKTNEVRIFTRTDSLLAVVEVGDYPSEFAISEKRGLCFVSCMEDVTTFAGDPTKRGSVAIIDLNTHMLVKHVYSGYQPHGLAVDDDLDLLVVGNRNTNPNGPAPHHTTDCGGRNGYVTLIDLNTLERVDPVKVEVSVDPYSVAAKH